MKKPLLSIIVPAYNAEKSIGRLIKSLVSQEYKDYELIIVNDGSTDNTKNIVEKYAKEYSLIKFIDKENTGVGDTRNQGLKIAKGKYIAFADSDDYYMPNYFDVIIPEIKKGDFELLVFNANVSNFNKITNSEISSKYKTGDFINENGVIEYLNGNFSYRIANVPWNKIYVAKIIKDNKMKYEVNKKRGQDYVFNVLYVSKIKKYRYIDEKLYVYILDYDPIKSDLYFDNYINHILEYYKPLKKTCIDNKIDWKRYMSLFFLKKFPAVILNEIKCPNRKQGIKTIKKYLKNKDIHNILKYLKLKDFNFKMFVSYIIYKLRLYKIVYYVLWKYRNRSKKNEK